MTAPQPTDPRDPRMIETPYVRFQREELILRDHLAVDRTALANERTLLTYLRTALTFCVAGASALHFLTNIVTDVAGAALIAVGLLVAALGVRRYRWYRARIGGLRLPDRDVSN